MTTEILINVAPRETRAALIENGVLTELFVERQSRRGIVSNLYKGRVQRVLPGMQAAFIDVGLERTAFLHAADIAARVPESTLIGEQHAEDIRRLVNEGDDILELLRRRLLQEIAHAARFKLKHAGCIGPEDCVRSAIIERNGV